MKVRKASEVIRIERRYDITDSAEMAIQWGPTIAPKGTKKTETRMVPKSVSVGITNGAVTMVSVTGDATHYENGEVTSRESDITFQWADIDAAPVWLYAFGTAEGHPLEGK